MESCIVLYVSWDLSEECSLRPGRPVCRQLAILRFLCFRGGGENKFEKHKRAFFLFRNSRINSKGTKPYPYFWRHLGEVSNLTLSTSFRDGRGIKIVKSEISWAFSKLLSLIWQPASQPLVFAGRGEKRLVGHEPAKCGIERCFNSLVFYFLYVWKGIKKNLLSVLWRKVLQLHIFLYKASRELWFG